MKFLIKDFFSKCDQIRRELRICFTFTEEILNRKLHFLCSANAGNDWNEGEHSDQQLTIFAKSSRLDVWMGSQYTSDLGTVCVKDNFPALSWNFGASMITSGYTHILPQAFTTCLTCFKVIISLESKRQYLSDDATLLRFWLIMTVSIDFPSIWAQLVSRFCYYSSFWAHRLINIQSEWQSEAYLESCQTSVTVHGWDLRCLTMFWICLGWNFTYVLEYYLQNTDIALGIERLFYLL